MGTGLLIEREVLKRDDDFGGHEIKPKSLVASSNVTIMYSPDKTSLAIPAKQGSEEWRSMRSGYLLEREEMLRQQHKEAVTALSALQQEWESNQDLPKQRGPPAIYAFVQQLQRMYTVLNRVITPIQKRRNPPAFLPDVVAPPENQNHTFDPEFIESWMVQTFAATSSTMAAIKQRSSMLASTVNDAIARSDAEIEAAPDKTALLETEFSTFFVRKADPKACSGLLDSLNLCLDALHGRRHFDFSAQRVPMSDVGQRMQLHDEEGERGLGTLSYSRMLLPDTWALVRNAPLFRSSVDGSELMNEIASKLRPLLFSPETLVIKQGTIGMSMYFVNSGCCKVAVNNQDIATRKPGDFFGELALTLVQERMADVYAEGTTELFELSRGNFNDIIKRYPHVYDRIRAVGTARVKKSRWEERLTESEKLELLDDEHLSRSNDLTEVNEAVSGVVDDVVVTFEPNTTQESFFEGAVQADVAAVSPESVDKIKKLLQSNSFSDETWSSEMWAAIVSRLKRIKAEGSVLILKHGDNGKNLYIVESGEITTKMDGLAFGTLNAGNIFGAEALFLSGMQTCDYEAGADGVDLLKLGKKDLVHLLSAFPVFYEFLRDVAAVQSEKRQAAVRTLGLHYPPTVTPAAAQ